MDEGKEGEREVRDGRGEGGTGWTRGGRGEREVRDGRGEEGEEGDRGGGR